LRLLVISHTPHYRRGDQLVGWGPTTREIDHLAQEFDEIRHIACLYPTPAPASSLPYVSNRIKFIGVPPCGGNHLRQKLSLLCTLPIYFKKILQELPSADVVHVRCPANISMIAIILLAFVKVPRYRWVKYAGNWQPRLRRALSYTLQRWWLVKALHHGTVTINGKWPNLPEHIYSFPNPCLSADEVGQGREIGMAKVLTKPLQLLFVGALNTSKGIDRALKIVKELQNGGVVLEFNVMGDGKERNVFETWSKENGLSHCIHFHGWQPRPLLAKFYARAHILLHPTDSDGWPKVLSEAMAYGVVPVAGAVSAIPQTLTEAGAGVALPPYDLDAFTNAIVQYYASPQKWKASSEAGLEAVLNFTYERYLEKTREMFQGAWGISLSTSEA